MRKIMLLACTAGALALAGCDNAAEEADDTAADTTAVAEPAATPTPAATVADGGPPNGTFEVTHPDGTKSTEVIAEDGTVTFTRANGETGNGTWRIDDAGNWCTVVAPEAEQCFAESVDANGVWNSVNTTDPEDTGVVVRMEG